MRMHTIPQNVSAYQDKIVGALIGKQFVYLAVGAVISFVIFFSSIGPSFLRLIIVIPIVLLSVALALLNINDRRFDEVFFAYVASIFGPTEWIWGKEKHLPPELADTVLAESEYGKIEHDHQENPSTVKSRRAKHYQSLFQDQAADPVDAEEQTYLQNLDFSIHVPDAMFQQAAASSQDAPPMLTPQNYQQASELAKKPTTPAKLNFASQNPVSALAGNPTGRRTYIAADNTVSITKPAINPGTNRSLSRRIVSGQVSLPIRGERSLPIPQNIQQELSQIVASQVTTTPTMEAASLGNTQPSNNIPSSDSGQQAASGLSLDSNDITNTTPMSDQPNNTLPTSNAPANQPAPAVEYEATFGQSNRQYFEVDQDTHQLNPAPAIPPIDPAAANQVTYNAPPQTSAPIDTISAGDAAQIEQSLADLSAAANPNAQPAPSAPAGAKFDKFSSSPAPITVDINLNSTIAPASQGFQTSDSTSFAPVPVSPVLPNFSTDAPLPADPLPTPPAAETTPTPAPVNNSAVKVVAAAATLAVKQIQLTQEANIISGRVVDAQGQSMPGVIIVVKNDQGEAKRALKTNKLGQFLVTTPLSNGTYTVEVDKKGYNFDIMQVELSGQVLPLIEIAAH